MKEIFFITSNDGKVHEAKNKLHPLGYRIIKKNLGYPEIQTDSLEEVARYGVQHVQKTIDHPFILEDAGLFIDALQGFPGVYSSYVYHTIGLDGVLSLLTDKKKRIRSAVFRSVFAYAKPEGDPLLFVGECNGMISTEKKGGKGFGYDPIFMPLSSDRTFAEMRAEEKNAFSHRGKSLEKLVHFLRKKSTD